MHKLRIYIKKNTLVIKGHGDKNNCLDLTDFNTIWNLHNLVVAVYCYPHCNTLGYYNGLYTAVGIARHTQKGTVLFCQLRTFHRENLVIRHV